MIEIDLDAYETHARHVRDSDGGSGGRSAWLLAGKLLTVTAELRATEGDLAIAVHEATAARSQLERARRMVESMRLSKYRNDPDWLWLNFSGAVGVGAQPPPKEDDQR